MAKNQNIAYNSYPSNELVSYNNTCQSTAICAYLAPATLAGNICNKTPRTGCVRKLVLLHCSISLSQVRKGVLPATSICTALQGFYNNATPNVATTTLLFSPDVLELDESEPTFDAIPMGDCIADYNATGACTISFKSRANWNINVPTPALGPAAVADYGEKTYWDYVKANGTSFNVGMIDCNGNLIWLLNNSGTAFADVQITVSNKNDKINSNCVNTTYVKLNFKTCYDKSQPQILISGCGGTLATAAAA